MNQFVTRTEATLTLAAMAAIAIVGGAPQAAFILGIAALLTEVFGPDTPREDAQRRNHQARERRAIRRQRRWRA